MPSQLSPDQELVITRTFDAPKQRIWDAFTKPEHLNHWWGPTGFEMHTITLDLRPEGIFHYSMKSGAMEMWGKFVYKEVQAPDRLVFINCFSDADGAITRNPWMPAWPLEVHNTMTLAEENGKTTLTLRGGPVNASDEEVQSFLKEKGGMQEGFKGSFDKLDVYLKDAQ
jgi:uncharacterized protein YndB with AHSA1/START domain